jgi:hypothetical protein
MWRRSARRVPMVVLPEPLTPMRMTIIDTFLKRLEGHGARRSWW